MNTEEAPQQAFLDELQKIAADKAAGSALRSQLKMVPQTVAYGLKGGKRQWSAMLGDQRVGTMLLDKGVVSAVNIEPKFRGMGLGKKMYGEVMRTQPKQALTSDSALTDGARGVWNSLKRDPSYKVNTLAEPTSRSKGHLLTNGQRQPHMFNESNGPQFSGSLPEASARPVKLPFEPRVAAGQAVGLAADYGPLAGAAALAGTAHHLDKKKKAKESELQKAAGLRTKFACVQELLEQNVVLPQQATALLKMAAVLPPVSHDEAEASLSRLKGLDTQGWSGDQARRGAALGAVAAPVLSVAQKAIAGDPVLGRPTETAMKAFRALPKGGGGRMRALAKVPVMAARNLAGAAAIGAVGGGVMPTVKHEVEREAERDKLRRYVGQGGEGA